MSIAGVVVLSRPERVEEVRERLLLQPGVEVHAATEKGQLVVVIEDEEPRLSETVMGLQELEGVLSASLIYHHFEQGLTE